MSTHFRLITAVAVIALFLAGCDEDSSELPFAPSNCDTAKPDFGFINVVATINGQNQAVPVTVYSGNVEDLITVMEDTVSTNSFTYVLRVEKTYALTARYVDGRDTILVIDAAKIQVNSTDYRDRKCYESVDGEVDLRLRSKTGTRHVDVSSVEDIVRAWMRDHRVP